MFTLKTKLFSATSSIISMASQGKQEVSDSGNSKLTLYSYWRSSCAWRVRIALNLKGLSYEYRPVNILKKEHFSEEYTKVNPLQFVPSLVDGDRTIADSLAIILYLEEKYPEHPLLPNDIGLKAISLQATTLIESSIQPFQNAYVLNLIEDKLGAEERMNWANHFVERGFIALEKILKDVAGKFCVGDQVTLADIYLAPQVGSAGRFNVDMSKFPTLQRIEKALGELPAFQAARPEKQPDATV